MVIQKEKDGRVTISPAFGWSVLVVVVGATLSGGLFGGKVSADLLSLSTLLSGHIADHAQEAKAHEDFKRAIERRVDHVERENGNGSVRLEAIKEGLADLKEDQKIMRTEQRQIIQLLQDIKRSGAGR